MSLTGMLLISVSFLSAQPLEAPTGFTDLEELITYSNALPKESWPESVQTSTSGIDNKPNFERAKRIQLLLPGITNITTKQAQIVAKYHGRTIRLPDLKSLSPLVAEELSKWYSQGDYGPVGTLILGVTTLDTDSAEALSKSKATSLYLPSLNSLPAATAQALASYQGYELSIGVPSISLEAAQALSTRHKKGESTDLILSGLTTLSAEIAAALSRCDKNSTLLLTGLTSLPADAAQALKGSTARAIHLGIPELTPETAASLRQAGAEAHELNIVLPNVDSISAETMRALLHENSGTTLEFENLKDMSFEAAWTMNRSTQSTGTRIMQIEHCQSREVLSTLRATCKNYVSNPTRRY